MKEYTFASLISMLVAIALDNILRTKVTRRPDFWVFIVVMFGFKLIFNGYLTSRPIVLYGEQFNLALRIGTIPVEDFLFGFSLITLTVIFWELARGGQKDVGKSG